MREDKENKGKAQKKLKISPTSSWLSKAGFSAVGFDILATIAEAGCCRVPSGRINPGINEKAAACVNL